jgi:putative acetyltransferase
MSGEAPGTEKGLVRIRPAADGDRAGILAVHGAAFPEEDVAGLTAALLEDPSAAPMTSLVADAGGRIVGHVLFTAAALRPASAHRAALLAPVGVAPDFQRRGIGGRLVTEGLAMLARSGMHLVFVLGHPAWYPQFGFIPAGEHGFAAPYPIPPQHADAWMVLALGGGSIPSHACTVRCAMAIDHPAYWRE